MLKKSMLNFRCPKRYGELPVPNLRHGETCNIAFIAKLLSKKVLPSQETNISHLWKGNIIFESALEGDMYVVSKEGNHGVSHHKILFKLFFILAG